MSLVIPSADDDDDSFPVLADEGGKDDDSPTEYLDCDSTVFFVCWAREARAGDLNLNSEGLPEGLGGADDGPLPAWLLYGADEDESVVLCWSTVKGELGASEA